MAYHGTIVRVQRSRAGITLVIDVGMGLRGVDLDGDLWTAILKDFGRTQDSDLTGWAVEYDPEHGDLEITGPARADLEDDPPAGEGGKRPESA